MSERACLRWRGLGRGLASIGLLVALLAPAGAVRAVPSVQTSLGAGFDSCVGSYPGTQPSASQLQAWWSGTPYFEFYFYLGGSYALCPGVSATWASQVLNEGWGLVATWVGPQCCQTTATATWISTNTTTAYDQGVSQADAAGNAYCAIGFCYGDPEPIVYDFEFDTNQTAEHAFVQGWTNELHRNGFKAGAYASVANPSYEVQDWASLSPPPDFVWVPYPNGQNTVWGIYELSNSDWVYDQRHHQYQSGHNSTENGVPLHIDSDCAGGPVFGQGASYGDSETSEGGASEDPYSCVTVGG